MSIKTKTQLEQELLDAERIKVIVDSGELATDTEVVLVGDTDNVAQDQGPVTKTSEEVVDDYLGEMALSHEEEEGTEVAEFDPSLAAVPAAEMADDMTLSTLQEPQSQTQEPLAPSETTSRPFLSKAPQDGKQLPSNAYFGADPSVSLMG